jgi:two-component system invasion response regulator UvrY
MDQGKKIKIALLDDNMLFRKGLKLLLSSFEGFSVLIEADNLPALVDKLNNASVHPDICIISSHTLMQNNNQALKEIKRTFLNMRVLPLAQYYDLFAVYKMMHDGADGYVLKNCNPSELKKALSSIKETGRYWDKELVDNLPNTSRGDYNITKSQLTFLSFCITDLTYHEMAERMGLSPRTIDGFRELLFKKFKVDNRTTLALFAVKNGIIKIE